MINRDIRTNRLQCMAILRFRVLLPLLSIALMFCCQACSESFNQQEKVREAGPDRSRIQKGIPPAQFAQTMESGRLKRLREGIREINLGEREDSVIAKIGPPDEVELSGPKQAYRPEEFMRVLVYDVRLVNSERGNTWDQTVEMYFDSGGQLVLIDSNVAGIESRSNKNWKAKRQ